MPCLSYAPINKQKGRFSFIVSCIFKPSFSLLAGKKVSAGFMRCVNKLIASFPQCPFDLPGPNGGSRNTNLDFSLKAGDLFWLIAHTVRRKSSCASWDALLMQFLWFREFSSAWGFSDPACCISGQKQLSWPFSPSGPTLHKPVSLMLWFLHETKQFILWWTWTPLSLIAGKLNSTMCFGGTACQHRAPNSYSFYCCPGDDVSVFNHPHS